MGLFDLFSDSNEAKAKNDLVKGYTNAATASKGQIDTGLGALRGDYATAADQYAPYTDSGKQAVGLYSDALGLNGADGSQRAVGAYQASPGYQYAADQAIQALERRAASQGQLGSGQTGIDTLNTVYGLANQDYGSWLDRLNGQQGLGLNAASGASGVYTGLGNAEYQAGSDKGTIDWNSILGSAQAKADYEKGKDQTGANILGAVTGGLSLGAKVLGLGGFGAPQVASGYAGSLY